MTFGRFARVVALVVVLVALWLARTPDEPARIVVLALPGASREQALAATAAPSPPRAILSGSIRIDPARPGVAVWRSLFASDPLPGTAAPLWADAAGATIRVFAAPDRVFPGTGGEAAERGFVGTSSGALVEAEDLTAGRLPAPWDRAIEAVSSEAASMRTGLWSPWIPVPSAPGAPATDEAVAEFQFVRYSETGYFLSPAYALRSAGPERPTAFLRGLDAVLKPLAAEHAIARAERFLDKAGAPFDAGSRGGWCIVFDAVAEDAAEVFAPDLTATPTLEAVHVALGARVQWALDAAGADGRVLVVGGPGTARPSSPSAWYALLPGKGASEGRGVEELDLSLEGARGLLRFLLGLPLTANEREQLPPSLAKDARGAVVESTTRVDSEPPQNPWTPAALESAGASAR